MKHIRVKNTKTVPLPIVDISGLYGGSMMTRMTIGNDIVDACEEYGFFYIQGYDIDQAEIDNWFKNVQRFFERDQGFKEQYSIHNSDRFQGYEPPKSDESKEAYVLGPERSADDELVRQQVKYHGANVWPDIDGWRSMSMKQMSKMLELARLLNRALALGLGLKESYFDKLSRDPMYAMRYLHYKPSNITGINTHTDWGMLSLLIQDAQAGLQIQDQDKNWLTVAPIKNTMVVNIGEMVEVFTDGRLKATKHKVVNATSKDRYSMAFFLDMDYDAVLAPVHQNGKKRYEPITVSDFIENMHQRDYGGLK